MDLKHPRNMAMFPKHLEIATVEFKDPAKVTGTAYTLNMTPTTGEQC